MSRNGPNRTVVADAPESYEAHIIETMLIRDCLGKWRTRADKTLSKQGHLSRVQAHMLYLHLYADLDYAEIGRLIGKPANTVRYRVEGAYKKLKRLLTDS